MIPNVCRLDRTATIIIGLLQTTPKVAQPMVMVLSTSPDLTVKKAPPFDLVDTIFGNMHVFKIFHRSLLFLFYQKLRPVRDNGNFFDFDVFLTRLLPSPNACPPVSWRRVNLDLIFLNFIHCHDLKHKTENLKT